MFYMENISIIQMKLLIICLFLPNRQAINAARRLEVVVDHVFRMSRAFLKNSEVKFISLEDAAKLKTGTRVTMSPGFPALYAECLKNICYTKRIPVIRVKHVNIGKDRKTGEDRQKRLFELTAQTSLPVMWHNDERPRSSWIEQLALCERIGAPNSPKLVPGDMHLRKDMFGLCALVLAEDGYCWNMRIQQKSKLAMKYGYSKEASKEAPYKMAAILKLICDRLEQQHRKGSRFLVGDSLTAVDIYMATMSYSIQPPDEAFMPRTKLTKMMDVMFGVKNPVVKAAITPRLMEHRDFILRTYCEVPVVLGGGN